MHRWLIPALATLALACTSAKVDDDDEDGGSDTGNGSDGGDDGSADPDSPVVEEADAWCYKHETGDEAYFWVVVATADDPQGADTIESFFDGVTVLSGDAELANYTMVCDSNGACTGSFNQDQDGISCANASSYTVRVQVVDDEENWSDPFDVTGKECADAAGC